MSITQYNPDQFLVSLHESLESVLIANVIPEEVYQIEMGGVDPIMLEEGFKTPLPKVIVTCEIDDTEQFPLGFGNPGKEVLSLDEATVVLHEAQWHTVAFDIGVWASAEVGGQTSCLRVHQMLTMLFSGGGARDRLRAATDGIEVRDFAGGRFMLDRLNDLPVWRVVDIRLSLRVFSRFIPAENIGTFPALDGFEQEQLLTDADGNSLT